MLQIEERVEERYVATEKEEKECENDRLQKRIRKREEGPQSLKWREESRSRGEGKGEFRGWAYSEVCKNTSEP